MRVRGLTVVGLLSALTIVGCTGAQDSGGGTSSDEEAVSSSAAQDPEASSSAPDDAADPTESPTGPEVVLTHNGSAVTDLGSDLISDQTDYIHLTWPVVPGAEALSEALAQDAETEVEAYRQDFVLESGEDVVAHPSLSGSWSLAGYSPEVVGVLSTDYLFAGANGAEGWGTTWFDMTSGEVLDNLDLVADDQRDALAAAVREQAQSDLPFSVSTDSLDQAMAEGPDVVGFTDHGELAIGFSENRVAAAAAGRVTVTLPPEVTDQMLSDTGRAARQAALDPQDPGGAQQEDPPETESPTAPPQEGVEPVDCTIEKCIALTYDDGPGPHTQAVIDAFNERNQRATFFVLGSQVTSWPEQVSAAVAGGHEVGVHTWDHPSLPPLGAAGTRDQLQRTIEAVQEAGGDDPVLFRPPYGATDDQVLAGATELGLGQVLWSVDTLDWQDRDSAVVTQRVLDEAQPGAIVLMHDIHESTAAATEDIVDGLLADGYHLVTVSELLGGV